jgi:hypothetical protein
MDKSLYERTRHQIRDELQNIARLTRAGDDAELLAWAKADLLAGAQRPLRYDPRFLEPSGRPMTPLPAVARDPVAAWTDRVRSEGIRTIMCLATCRELARYSPLELHDDGLLGYLRSRGLRVCHLPLRDPAHLLAHELAGWRQGELRQVQAAALGAFPELGTPLLVFCSGGADRTPPILAYIVANVERSA